MSPLSANHNFSAFSTFMDTLCCLYICVLWHLVIGAGDRLAEAQLSRLSSPGLTSFMRPLCLVTIARETEAGSIISSWIQFSVTKDHSWICKLLNEEIVLESICSVASSESLKATVWWSGPGSNFLPEVESQVLTYPRPNPPTPDSIVSFDLPALYLVSSATFELKEFLARARGGAIRIMKIVIRNGKHEVSLAFAAF